MYCRGTTTLLPKTVQPGTTNQIEYKEALLDRMRYYAQILKDYQPEFDPNFDGLDELLTQISYNDILLSTPESDIVLAHSYDVGAAVEKVIYASEKLRSNWRGFLEQEYPDYDPDIYSAETTIAAYLHDIGKVKINHLLVYFSGDYDEQQKNEMEKHAQHTGDILWKLGFGKYIPKIAAHHHSALNGEGYFHKEGEAIPLGSRLIRIFDILIASTGRDLPNHPRRTTQQTYNFLTSPKRIRDEIDQELLDAIRESFFEIGFYQERLVALKNFRAATTSDSLASLANSPLLRSSNRALPMPAVRL